MKRCKINFLFWFWSVQIFSMQLKVKWCTVVASAAAAATHCVAHLVHTFLIVVLCDLFNNNNMCIFFSSLECYRWSAVEPFFCQCWKRDHINITELMFWISVWISNPISVELIMCERYFCICYEKLEKIKTKKLQ